MVESTFIYYKLHTLSCNIMRPQARLKNVLIDTVGAAADESVGHLGANEFMCVITGRGLDEELEKVRNGLLARKRLPDEVVAEVLTSSHPHSLINNHLTDLYKKRYLSRAKAEGKRRWALQYCKGPRFRFFKAHSSSGVREGMKGGVGIFVAGKPIPDNPMLDAFTRRLTRQLSLVMADEWRNAWLVAHESELEGLHKQVNRKLEACLIEPRRYLDRKDVNVYVNHYLHLREKAQLLPLTKGTQSLLKRIYGFIPEPEIRIDLRQLEPIEEVTSPPDSSEENTET